MISPPDDIRAAVSEPGGALRRSGVCQCTCDQSEALHAGEVGVLDGHDAGLSEQLLRVVVDQLPADAEEDFRISTGSRGLLF